jgi:predicted DNA-binding transcriptional regulator YafY
MRAARLIKMVLLLQSRPAMTAAELAGELDVSERTVTRDAQALSEAGVPVYADRGRSGGYRLVGGYRTRLTGLARGEAEALFLSGVPGALRDMGLDDAASAARLKVSAALLPSLRDASDSAARRFHLDAPGWFQEPAAPELLPDVAGAVWADQVLRVRYGKDAGGAETGAETGTETGRASGGAGGAEFALSPYGLVLKAGVWYLCACSRGEFRVYRVDRFRTVRVSEERFVRDESFDLPGFWAERAARFARSLLRAEAVLRLTPEGVRLLPRQLDRAAAGEAIRAAGEPDGQGRITVTVPVESEEVAYAQLLPLGPEAEVLAPTTLRLRLARAAAAMSALYG